MQENIALTYEAKGVREFVQASKDSEMALRRQARSLDEVSLALQKELLELKRAAVPNKELIIQKQRLLQQNRLLSAETKQQILLLKQEALAAQAAIKPVDNLTSSLVGQTAAVLGTGAALVGLVSGVKAAAASFGDFERTLNTIKAVSGATSGDLEAIKKSSLELGQKTVFSNQQVADSYLELARAGFTTSEALAAMPGLLSLAAAAGGDLSKSAEITAGILRGFNMQASQSGHVADVLAQAANVSAGEITDFGLALKQLAPLAVSSNQSLEDLTGLLAVLSNRMINGADAGTDLKAILARLVGPETQKMLKSLGVQVSDTEHRIKPLAQIVDELRKKFATLSQAGQVQVAAKIAGLENVKSLLALINTSKGEIDEFINKMKNADGQAQLMSDTINQGLNTSLEQLGGSLETLGAKLGEKLAPAISTVIQAFTDLFNAISKNDFFQSFVIGGAAAIATAGTLVTSMLVLPPTFTAIGTAAAALSATLGISTGGLWWVFTGLAAAGGAVGVMLEKQTQQGRILEQSSLELRGEVDRLTDSQAQEAVKAVKLAKEYDELAKKKNLTKGESERLGDITDTLLVKFATEGESVAELTRKYGSLAAAIREKSVAQLADTRLENLKVSLKETQSARKDAGLTLAELEERQSNPFSVPGFENGTIISKNDPRVQRELRRAKLNLARQKSKEESLKKSISTVLEDTRAIYNAAENPKPVKSTPPFGTGSAPDLRKAKHLKDKTPQVERQKIQDIRDKLTNKMQDIDLEFQGRLEMLGAFASEAQKAGVEVEKATAKTNALQSASDALLKINLKSKEGDKERDKALTDVSQSIKSNANDLLKLRNNMDALDDATNQSIVKARNEAGKIKLDTAIGQQKIQFEAQKRELDDALKQGAITETQFYDSQRDLIERNTNLQKLQMQTQIASMEEERDLLHQTEQDEQRRREINNEILALKEKIKLTDKEAADQAAQINEQEARQGLSRRLQDNFQDDLSQAIQDALTGQGVAGALKQFAKAFRNNIVKELADGLSKLVVAPMKSFFSQIAGYIRGFTGQTQTGSVIPGGLSSGSSGNLLPTLTGRVISKPQSVSPMGPLLTSNAPIAAAGQGVKIPTAQEDAVNGSGMAAVSAAAVPIAIAAYSASKAIQSKGSVGMKYLRFIDPLGFRKLFGIDTGKSEKRQAERHAYQDNELQPFLNRVISGADANNLNDLMARRLQAARGMKANGERGMQMKRDALAEIDKLIKQRKTTIDEFLKDIRRQNEQLQDEIRLADAKPFERAAIEREMAIKQIEFDTKRLLEQYKDSETAKTEILKQESLKRQQLIQQETEDFKAKTQALRDLLIERDDIANANVFQRLRSPERVKADRLTDLDRQIAETVLELKGMQTAGIDGASFGSNQIKNFLNQINQNNQFQFVVNGATDPNAVSDVIARQLESVFRKLTGANIF